MTIKEAIDKAIEFREQGQWDKSIDLYQQVLHLHNKDGKVLDPIAIGIIALGLEIIADNADEVPDVFRGRAAWLIAHKCDTCSIRYRQEYRSLALKLENPSALAREALKRLNGKHPNRKAARRILLKMWDSHDRVGAMAESLCTRDPVFQAVQNKAYWDWERAAWRPNKRIFCAL